MTLQKEITNDELYILKQVFSKVEYDETIEKYIVRLDAYLPLKLTKEQRDLLEKICRYYDIALEKLPKHLTQKEALPLFIEYDKLKKELASSNSEKLRNRMIEVRNQLVEGHLEPMYIMIYKYLKDYENKYDAEDIYQDCCEVLIELIEKYNPYAGVVFSQYMYYYGYQSFWRKLNISNDNLNTNNSLNKLLVAKRRHQEKFGSTPSIEDLKNAAGLHSKQVESLLKLEQTLEHTISLDEYYESTLEEPDEESKEYQSNIIPALLDDSLEDRASAIWLREVLLKIIDTLPGVQREITLMRYGFTTGIPLTIEEISNKLNVSPQRVGAACQEVIDKLKSPRLLKYLEQAVEGYTNDIYPDMEEINHQSEMKKRSEKQISRERSYIEVYLLSKLNKEELAGIIKRTISNKEDYEFLNQFFGVNGEPLCSSQAIMERLGIDSKACSELKRKALRKLISILERRCSQSFEQFSEEELIDYLMNKYLTNNLTRILRK